MKVIRHPDWSHRLSEFLVAQRSRPYVRDCDDCVQFCVLAVRAMTGTDLSGLISTRYPLRREARCLLQRSSEGLGGAVGQVLSSVGCGELPVCLAVRGDIVLFSYAGAAGEEGEGLGICCGEQAVTPGRRGMVAVVMRRASRVWRIPFGHTGI